jgi:hypothetical protein
LFAEWGEHFVNGGFSNCIGHNRRGVRLHGLPAVGCTFRKLCCDVIWYGNADIHKTPLLSLSQQRRKRGGLYRRRPSRLSRENVHAVVDSRVRQAHLRHTDPRLTEDTYFDSSLFLKPHADELGQVPALPIGKPTILQPDQVSADAVEKITQLVRETSGSQGHLEATPVISCEPERVNGSSKIQNSSESQVEELAGVGIKRQGPASCDVGPIVEAGEGGRTRDIHVGKEPIYRR